jgi:hypothetical protein
MITSYRPETYKNKKPQITQITQIFFLRVPSCNFVANFLVIFMGVPHDASLTQRQ